MLPQDPMIERLRQICQSDERLVAAMLYGSFTRGEADEFSDIDVMLFFDDKVAPDIDQQAWVSPIAPIELYHINEFGAGVAIFDNLVRAEFHFDRAADMRKLETFHGLVWFPSLASTLLLDRTGQLAQHLQRLIGPPPAHDTPAEALSLCQGFLNWTLLGANVLLRGEEARALEILRLVQDHLLRMTRLSEGQTANWITPTKALEQEISSAAYQRYRDSTAPLERTALWKAYLAAWQWGNEMMQALTHHFEIALPTRLVEKIDRRLQQ